MSEITDEDVAAYKALMPPPRVPEMTEEMLAAAQAITVKRKAFLKALKERTGKSEKSLEKDIKKKISKSKPKVAKPKKKNVKKEETVKDETINSLRGILPEPKDNTGSGEYFVNSPEILKKYLEETGGVWQTRFPPEPNGYLHIGHAKAMLVNFGQAKKFGGSCLLRFDDTNPEAEKQEYIDAIIENVKWLGHEPSKITYSSDHFDKLLELAKELIRRDKAYVCHQTPEEVKASRDHIRAYHIAKNKSEDKIPFPEAGKSPFRDRPTEESLKLFEEMIDGKWKEGTATLRMKMDLESPNANMWDHMAYRILFKEHPRTKDKFCVYPTYDYTHCLVDSLENISHSLCTLEFADRQAPNGSYHWLIDALDMYHACTWEYSRCSISANVLSKRKILRLVNDGLVSGWDDPRLLTLAGLRRRGYTASAINNFCDRIGIARTSNNVCVAKEQLETCIREELDEKAPRVQAVLDPLEVFINNHKPTTLSLANHPNDASMGTRDAALTETIFIEREKFAMEDSKGYKGLAPGKTVRLMGGAMVTFDSVETNSDGSVKRVIVALNEATDIKPSGTLAWVPSNAIPITANLYRAPFKDCELDGVERDADAVAGKKNIDFLTIFDKDSHTAKNGLIEPSVKDDVATVGKSWQFITLGYFCVDKTSTTENPQFNLIVSLKEAKSKGKK